MLVRGPTHKNLGTYNLKLMLLEQHIVIALSQCKKIYLLEKILI